MKFFVKIVILFMLTFVSATKAELETIDDNELSAVDAQDGISFDFSIDNISIEHITYRNDEVNIGGFTEQYHKLGDFKGGIAATEIRIDLGLLTDNDPQTPDVESLVISFPDTEFTFDHLRFDVGLVPEHEATMSFSPNNTVGWQHMHVDIDNTFTITGKAHIFAY